MFDGLVRNDWHIVSVIELGIGIVYIFIPMNSII